MKLITILGQTCSGKTQMSLDLFRHFQKLGKSCCVVNCDSRQIYKSLDYGTAKVDGVWKNNVYYVEGDIPHYLIDYVEPRVQYNLSNYLNDFCDLFNPKGNPQATIDPFKKGMKPDYVILVGGTGLYAKAINEEMDLGLVKKQFQTEYDSLKKELNKLDLAVLQNNVVEKNLNLNESDFVNKIRLVSNLLRFESTVQGWLENINYPKFTQKYYCAIEIPDQQELQIKIKNRIKLRINQGLISETKELILELGKKRVDELGLEYRLTRRFLDLEITESEWVEQLGNENWQYAKRQLTWIRREKNIIWVQTLDDLIKVCC